MVVVGRRRTSGRQNTRNVGKGEERRDGAACLKCGRRSRLLPIHLAQDGRQIELPPKKPRPKSLGSLLFLPSFLPSFLSFSPRKKTRPPLPLVVTNPPLLLSFRENPRMESWSVRRKGTWLEENESRGL